MPSRHASKYYYPVYIIETGPHTTKVQSIWWDDLTRSCIHVNNKSIIYIIFHERNLLNELFTNRLRRFNIWILSKYKTTVFLIEHLPKQHNKYSLEFSRFIFKKNILMNIM